MLESRGLIHLKFTLLNENAMARPDPNKVVPAKRKPLSTYEMPLCCSWKHFTIRNVELDKYGRVLEDVYAGDVSVATYLIDNGYALRYAGGTKTELDWDRLNDGRVN